MLSYQPINIFNFFNNIKFVACADKYSEASKKFAEEYSIKCLSVDEILNSFKNEINLIIEDGTLMNSASKIYKYEAGNLRNIR